MGRSISLHQEALLLKVVPVELAAVPGAKVLLPGSGDDHLHSLLVFLCKTVELLRNRWAAISPLTIASSTQSL